MKKLTNLALSLSLVVLSIQPTMAAQMPIPSVADERIATVEYKENDVTEVFVKPGIFTQIVFEDGEEYEVHALGDEAWHIAAYKNYLFIKPSEPLGTTNLSVITNKRHYMFKVNYITANATDMYQLRFIYPEVADEQTQEKIAKRAVEDGFVDGVMQKTYNLDYVMRVKGNRNIAPMNVYDDGTFTYFKFAGNVDLPAIYAVDTSDKNNNKEILVNSTVGGEGNNTIIMHKVNDKWRLRLDQTVIDVFNGSKDGQGVLNTTGTTSANVERVEVDEVE